jgi:hypothetical protein
VGLSVETDQIFKDGMTDTVTYTATGQSGVSISAIVHEEATEVRSYDDGQKTTRTIEVMCLTSDVTSPSKKDTFTIGGETWQVDDEMPTRNENAGTITIPLVIYADLETWSRRERAER